MRPIRFTRVLLYLAVLAAVAAPVAMAFGFDDGVKPPSGLVGTPYNFQFKGRNGCPPYTFHLQSGSLPPGLSLDSGGTISGTPTQAGTFSFWMEIHDSATTCPPNGSVPSQRPFTIEIDEKLAVTTNLTSPATTGTPYSVQFVASGGGSQVWSIYSGTPPAGLTFSSTGLLSGTPTATGTYDFVVKVTDGARIDTHAVELAVVDPLGVSAPTAARPGEVGVALTTAAPVATGGKPPYAWALTAGALPAGLALDPATGSIAGTPATPGTFSLQLSATDSFNTVATANLLLVVKAKVSVTTVKLPSTKIGRLYRVTLRTVGGLAPFRWKVTSGRFPVGISLGRTTGVVSGKPRLAGTFQLTFTVTDALGQTSAVPLTLKVNSLPKKKPKTT